MARTEAAADVEIAGMPALAVVMVTATGAEQWISDAIGSVQRSTDVHPRIVLVDNASTDRTRELVGQRHPEIEMIALPRNQGFGAANNLAVRTAHEPLVLFMNPDARILDHSTLSALVKQLSENPTIGVIGCRHVDESGTYDHNARRQLPQTHDAATYAVGRLLGSARLRARTAYTNPELDSDRVADVGAVSGAFMLVRREALDEVGLFDERFWMYGEDLDLCARMRARGWRVVYDGRHTIFHARSASAGKTRNPRANLAFHRALWIYYAKHEPRRSLFKDVAIGFGVGASYIVNCAAWVLSRVRRCRS